MFRNFARTALAAAMTASVTASVAVSVTTLALLSTSTATVAYDGGSYGGGSYGGGSYGGDDCAGGTSTGYDGSRTLQVVGLTKLNQLVCFNEFRPGEARAINFVSNLTGGDTALVGIDFRPANGLLYGVGNAGGVYQINTSNAVATLVNRLSVALDGSDSYGVDFNPAVDRLRIVSSKGQNLRHNLAGTTLVDGMLNYAPGVAAMGIAGSGYTNNDADPNTATTLYALDTSLDQIAIQSPPNAGTLAATGKLTLDAGLVAGFDIYSKIRNGSTVEVQSLASIKLPDGSTGLYSIRLFSGKATPRGNFANGLEVTDIAIPLKQL